MVKTNRKDCYLTDSCLKYKNGTCQSAEEPYCERLHKVDALFELAKIPPAHRKFQALFADKFHGNEMDREAFTALRDYLKSIEEHVNNGDNVYICSGTCGNGKTEWAYKLLKGYLGKIWAQSDLVCRGLFVSVPRYFISLKENITSPNEYAIYVKDNIISADLVVFDEIGVKGLTEFEHEQLLNVINTRIDMGKSNIYTSNLTPTNLSMSVGDRLASRIINLTTNYQFEFKGPDQRGRGVTGE